MIHEASVLFKIKAIEMKLQANKTHSNPLFPKKYTGHVNLNTTGTGTGYQYSRPRNDSSASQVSHYTSGTYTAAKGGNNNSLLYAHHTTNTNTPRDQDGTGSRSNVSPTTNIELISTVNQSVQSISRQITQSIQTATSNTASSSSTNGNGVYPPRNYNLYSPPNSLRSTPRIIAVSSPRAPAPVPPLLSIRSSPGANRAGFMIQPTGTFSPGAYRSNALLSSRERSLLSSSRSATVTPPDSARSVGSGSGIVQLDALSPKSATIVPPTPWLDADGSVITTTASTSLKSPMSPPPPRPPPPPPRANNSSVVNGPVSPNKLRSTAGTMTGSAALKSRILANHNYNSTNSSLNSSLNSSGGTNS